MNQNFNQQPTSPPLTPRQTTLKKHSNKVIVLMIILISLFIFIPAVISTGIAIWGTKSGLDKNQSEANNMRVKSMVQGYAVYANDYFEKNNTYIGFDVSAEDKSEVQKSGSEIFIQGLSKDTFLIYAKSPKTGKIYCMDNNFQLAEINKISSTQKNCK